jgi:hypothetical protein
VIGFIIREVAGWLLLALGLFTFFVSYDLLITGGRILGLVPGQPNAPEHQGGMLLTAPPVALIGFFIFRGGIHLLKVSIAARVSYRADREMTEPPRRPARKK